ncbi:MAG: DNA-binding protein [Burkholderiales bacterium PBB4]|nr:MAG: DNA-binding protein [Burkholderiales bacterium PBB4]
MDLMSTKKESATLDLSHRIALRVQALRAARGLSLEALATYCGVSRSMISLIERGESSPTAVLLEKLATGLGVPLASLFDTPDVQGMPVARAADQLVWTDPHSGYTRRNVSPPGGASPIQIVEVVFPPQARVAYETAAREPQIHQQVWVLEGSMDVTLGPDTHHLHAGDCLAFPLNQPTCFFNPERVAARYAVVIATTPGLR